MNKVCSGRACAFVTDEIPPLLFAGDAWLMYAAHNSLYNKTLHEHRCHLVNNAEGNIISFDYDARSKDIFWLLQKAVVSIETSRSQNVNFLFCIFFSR